MSAELKSQRYVGSRLKAGVKFAFCLLLTAVGFLPSRDSAASLGEYVALAFFGVGACVFAWLLFRPQVLVLSPTGFSFGGGLMRKSWMVHWRDIDHFFIFRPALGARLVAFNYRPAARATKPLGKLNRALGADASIGGSWRISARAMVKIMNEYKDMALRRSAEIDRPLKRAETSDTITAPLLS